MAMAQDASLLDTRGASRRALRPAAARAAVSAIDGTPFEIEHKLRTGQRAWRGANQILLRERDQRQGETRRRFAQARLIALAGRSGERESAANAPIRIPKAPPRCFALWRRRLRRGGILFRRRSWLYRPPLRHRHRRAPAMKTIPIFTALSIPIADKFAAMPLECFLSTRLAFKGDGIRDNAPSRPGAPSMPASKTPSSDEAASDEQRRPGGEPPPRLAARVR